MRKTLIISTLGIILLFITVAAIARVRGIPVKLRLVGKPRYAVAGEPFRASIVISAAADAELSSFNVKGNGWSVDLLDAPDTVDMKANEGIIVNLEATAEDPSKPLIFSFDINGQTFRKAFDLSVERYNKLTNPKRVKPVPGSGRLPFPGVERTGEDPLSSSILQQLFEEHKFIRHEINTLKRELIETRKIIEEYHVTADVSHELVKIMIDGKPILGDENAPVIIIEFSEYQCSSCREFYEQTFPMIKSDFIDTGKARYVFQNFPLTSHAYAVDAARTANCAGQQGKYWEMHDLLFKSQQNFKEGPWEKLAKETGLNPKEFLTCMADKSIEAGIQKDKDDGVVIGVTSIPAFLIGRTNEDGTVEGELSSGFQSIDFFEALITSLSER